MTALGLHLGLAAPGQAGTSRPLDALAASLLAAHGLRRLVSSWSGPLVTVRRDSDNAILDVAAAAGDWLDTAALLAFAGTASAYVTRWWDQSGLGRHAEQATAAAQPRLVNAGVTETFGARPALYFGAAAQLRATSPAFAQPLSVITSLRADTISGLTRRILDSLSSTYISTTGTIVANYGASLSKGGTAQLTEGIIVAYCAQGTGSLIGVNGTYASGDAGTDSLGASFAVGNRTAGGQGVTGQMGEVALIGASLDAAALSGIGRALGTPRGVTVA